MASVNKCIFIGRLTRDVELRHTGKGTAVTTIDLAINRQWKDSQGKKQEAVTYIPLTLWDKHAELAGKYLRKGDQCYVEARAENDSYERDGTTVKTFRFVGEVLQFLPNGRGDAGAAPAARQTARPRPSQPAPTPGGKSGYDSFFDSDEEINF